MRQYAVFSVRLLDRYPINFRPMNRFRHALLRVHPFFTLFECLGILLAYQLGVRVSGRIDAVSALAGSILACTSCVVVMQQSGVRESLREGGLRLLGTLIGVVIGCVYLLIFRFNVWGLLAAIFLQEVVCMLLAIPDNGKMATFSLVVVMLVSHFSPDLSPVLNGLLRFTEAAVGASIGIVAVWLLHLPERLRKRRRKHPANASTPDPKPVRIGNPAPEIPTTQTRHRKTSSQNPVE